jgi:hypothetical protein
VIISHKYRFIFIKTRKTAGTSIELALRPHLGPQDVATPIREDQVAVSSGARNWRRPFSSYTLYDWRRFLLDGKRQDFKNHLPGTRIRQMIPAHVWDNYYKFAVERDPYDKVVSGYYWTEAVRREQGREALTLPEFLARDAMLEDYSCWHRYAEGSTIIVDRVLRYENLASELAEVCTYLGLPTLSLPTAKAGHRTDRRPASEVLGWEGMERVAEVFGHELEVA